MRCEKSNLFHARPKVKGVSGGWSSFSSMISASWSVLAHDSISSTNSSVSESNDTQSADNMSDMSIVDILQDGGRSSAASQGPTTPGQLLYIFFDSSLVTVAIKGGYEEGKWWSLPTFPNFRPASYSILPSPFKSIG